MLDLRFVDVCLAPALRRGASGQNSLTHLFLEDKGVSDFIFFRLFFVKCVHNLEVHCMFTFRFIQLSYFAIKDTGDPLCFSSLVAIASVGQWFS